MPARQVRPVAGAPRQVGMARTRANNYGAKRRGILRRAAELFARHGFTGTSITMIAEACGMSKALLYHYYPSKEDVLFHLLDSHLRHLDEVVEQAAATNGDQARLHAIAAKLLDAYRGADAAHQVQIASLKLLPPNRQAILKEAERRMVATVSRTIAGAVPQLANRHTLLMPLTMSFFGMLNWHYLWFREGKGLTRDQYARMATTLILSGAEAAAAAAGEASAPGTTRRAKLKTAQPG
jgi:AcrR family transcriptional regulator